MDPGRWREIDALFEATLERSGEARQAFLDGLDSEVRREVERLLAADDEARTFLEGHADTWLPALSSAAALAEAPPRPSAGADLPERIGPYQVLGVLGEGGMGRVLLASRADEQYQRRVAIKTLRAPRPPGRGVLREGPPREELLARFDLERQALAQLEHPNIARLYDAGRDDRGDPYLVLEHIDGVPLDVYCDQKSLDVEARLRLFLEVCQAVSAAHRNLLVHRDLKPSNILVTPEGRPMLLDFGIAKLLDPGRIAGELPDRELYETREGSRPMTPGYASPEQIKGEPITTASDVYSLGVVLYELLTGRKPYRITSWQPHELERAICEVEPERPSTAVFRQPGTGERSSADGLLEPKEVARRRATSPAALARHLRGDLDTLLHKALRKDPYQRYASVEALGQDIQAYLAGKPLAARPPGAFYKLRKFARRHRYAAAAAVALVVLLSGFLVALGVQTGEIRAERDKAQRALAFLIEVFKASDPAGAEGEELKARDILDGAAGRIEKELAGQPEIQATLMDAMGQVYHSHGAYSEAERFFRQALERRIQQLGEKAPATLLTRGHLGSSLVAAWKTGPARIELERTLADRAPDAPQDEFFGDLLGDLALVETQDAHFDVAVVWRRRAAAVYARSGASFGKRTAAKANLIGSLMQAQRFEEHEPLLAELREETDRLVQDGSDRLEMANSLAGVAEQLWQYGDPRAVGLFRRALEIRRKWLPEEHPEVVGSVATVVYVLDFEGELEAARALAQSYYPILRARLGPDHRDTLTLQVSLATVLSRLGRHAEALPLIFDAAERQTRILDGSVANDFQKLAQTWRTLAGIYREAGRFPEAERYLQEAQRRYTRLSEGRPISYETELSYARLRRAQKRNAAAVAHYRKFLADFLAAMGERHWLYSSIRGEYASFLVELGRLEEARHEALAGYNLLRRNYGPQTSMLEKPLEALLALYRKEGNPEAAAAIAAALADPAERPPHLE